MSIVVTTPTGHVGSRVTRLLVQAGERPVLLLRDPRGLPADLAEHVETRVGDLGDPDFVRESTRDAHVLFWVDPTDFGADDANAETVRLGRHAVAAIHAHGIGHVLFQSSVGAERRHGAGLIDGLAEVERLLDATPAHVLHLRCGYFFSNLLMDLDGLRAGRIATAMAPDAPLPWVDPRDIGDVVAGRLLRVGWGAREVQGVHGPRDLTFREVARILTEATGREVRVEQVEDDTVRAELRESGMAPATADGVVAMTTGLRDGFTPEQPRSALTTTPTELAGWAHSVLRPLLR